MIAQATRFATMLGLLLAAGCGVRTTYIGPIQGSALEPMVANIADEDLSVPTLTCDPPVANALGPLLDPPRSCLQSVSACTAGHVFQLQCDGMQCLCLVDGAPVMAFFSPSCPDITRIDSLCLWDGFTFRTSPETGGQQPNASEPCNVADDLAAQLPDCNCTDGFISCPTSAGCFLEGTYRQPDLGLQLTLRSDGTLFASSVEGATFESVRTGAHPGFFGTFQLSGDTLFMRTANVPPDPACDERVGSYAITRLMTCDQLSLRQLDDDCMQRIALTSETLIRQTP